MRKLGIVIVAAILLISMLVAGCAKPAPATTVKPSVVVTPAVAPLDAKTQIVIMGSDYQPGQKIKILIRDPQVGSLVNIATLVNPAEPVPNEQGAWATVWTLGRYVSRGVFQEGIYYIRITDDSGNILASAPIGLADVTKPREQWPTWAQAVIK